jgi:GTPase SAR1 family protein
MKEHYIRSSDGFLLLFDITSDHWSDSLEEIGNDMKLILRVKNECSFPMIIIGTKCDLEDQRKVSYEEIMKIATNDGIPFFETSAKLNINLEEAIFALIDQIYKRKALLPQKKAKDCLLM